MTSNASTGMRGRAGMALVALVTIGAGIVLPASEAFAQSRICRQIERELANLSSRGAGSSSESRRYDKAIHAQQNQIDKVRRQMRNSGCGGFFGQGGSSCSSLAATMERMNRNLLALQRKRGQMGGSSSGSRRERARLVASLDANGCRDTTPGPDYAQRERGGAPAGTVAARTRQDGNLFEQLFGGGIQRRESADDYDGGERIRTVLRPGTSDWSTFGGGTYRTLCVRTCDGYYFPISHSSQRDDFERDEQNCQTMCPGTEVKLYSHRVPDEESEAMVDQYGSPYTELPSAFNYRDTSFTRPESCGCNPVKNFTIVAGAPAPAQDSALVRDVFVSPKPRPDPASDSETQANRDGHLDAAVMQRMLTSKPLAGLRSGDRKVRVVGPEFLPDPEAALDLRAPARQSVQ